MATEIITKEDLNEFGEKLLEEIKRVLGKESFKNFIRYSPKSAN